MEFWYNLQNAEDLPSPALVFYENRIKENIAHAIKIAGKASRLRPHVKTHKTAEITKLELEMGISRFKCATVAEAEMLAKAGAQDILIAYNLYGKNAMRFAQLVAMNPRVKFSALADSEEAVQSLSNAARGAGARFGVFLDVDVGQHRTGIAPGLEAQRVYALIASRKELWPSGLHCYDGHNHQHPAEERIAAAKACHAEMESLRTPLLAAGLPVPEIVLGGTPTFPYHAKLTDPTVSLSPGTCFLQDFSYSENFKEMTFQPAALLVTRVVSVNSGRQEFCIDLGYKGVSADPKGVRGKILNLENCEPVKQNEEHWVFSARGTLPARGSVVYVIPTHICPTVALYERAYVANEVGVCTKEWKIAARDRVVGI